MSDKSFSESMKNLRSAADRIGGPATSLEEALALFDALRARSVVSLTLEVRDSNEPAIRLYESLGFRQVGLRKRYYFHPTEDARILKKEWNE